MRAAVFGASGFIGRQVAAQLAGGGHQVTSVLRPGGDAGDLSTPVTRLHFEDAAALARVLEGQELVFCCLANPRRHLPLPALRAVEVALSGRLLEAAARAGVRRFVQLSTVMVYGFERPPRAIDEDYPARPTHPFARVALEREQSLARRAEALGVELVILRPANATGPGDVQMASLFQSHRRGLYPVFGRGDAAFSAIDVRDIGRAMALLGRAPEAAGRTYLARGYDTSWLALKETLDRISGHRARLLRLPAGGMRALGGLLEKLLPYSFEPSLTRFSVDVLTTTTLFDDRRLRALGFAPSYGLEDSLRDYLAAAG